VDSYRFPSIVAAVDRFVNVPDPYRAAASSDVALAVIVSRYSAGASDPTGCANVSLEVDVGIRSRLLPRR
jgi:hypothetical protein